MDSEKDKKKDKKDKEKKKDKDKKKERNKEKNDKGHDARGIEKEKDSDKVKIINLHDFEMGETLGTGSFGRVKLTKHKKTGEFVAMKIMKKIEIIKNKQVDHIAMR